MQSHVSFKREEKEFATDRRENVTTEAEIGMMQPQTSDITEWHKTRDAGSHQKLEEARNKFFPRASKMSMGLPTLWLWPSETDFRLLASRTTREYISVVLNHQVCGNLSQHS